MKNASKDPSDLKLLKEIFGEGKKGAGNIEQANELMEKFLEMYPDGKCPPGKSRGKDFKLSCVVHSLAYRREKYSDENALKLDFELFCGKMRGLRGWDVARCKQEWEEIRADPDSVRDMGGPRHSKERLAIPAYLTGESRIGVRHGCSEERRVDTYSKPKKFTDGDMSKAFCEIDRGFKESLDVASFEEKSRLALPASAMLGRGDALQSPSELLRSVTGQELSAPSDAAGAMAVAHTAARHGAAAGSSAEGDGPPHDQQKAIVVDVRSTRNSKKKTLKDSVDKLRKRVAEARLGCVVMSVGFLTLRDAPGRTCYAFCV